MTAWDADAIARRHARQHAQGDVAETRDLVSDWRERGACIDHDPDLFFPVGNTGPAIRHIDEAKGVCNGQLGVTPECPVRLICLNWALDTGQDHGVWGGLAEDERRSLKRREARAERAARHTRRELMTDATETRAALLAARSAGMSLRELSEKIGLSYDGLHRITREAADLVMISTAEKVRETLPAQFFAEAPS